MALSLGAEGISYLAPGHWEVGVSYRYLHSENIFIGDREQPQIKAAGQNNITDIHSFDVSLTYAVTRRCSVSLNLPFTGLEGSAIHAVNRWQHMPARGLGGTRL